MPLRDAEAVIATRRRIEPLRDRHTQRRAIPLLHRLLIYRRAERRGPLGSTPSASSKALNVIRKIMTSGSIRTVA